MCEQIGVVDLLQISSQDSVEALEIVRQEPISETMCEQIGVSEVSKISSQVSVEAVEQFSLGSGFLKGCVNRSGFSEVHQDLKPGKCPRQSTFVFQERNF